MLNKLRIDRIRTSESGLIVEIWNKQSEQVILCPAAAYGCSEFRSCRTIFSTAMVGLGSEGRAPDDSE